MYLQEIKFYVYRKKFEIGQRIQKLREKQGYTREHLAEIAEISDRFLTDIETGRKGTSSTTILKLAIALNTTTDFLLVGNK